MNNKTSLKPVAAVALCSATLLYGVVAPARAQADVLPCWAGVAGKYVHTDGFCVIATMGEVKKDEAARYSAQLR